MKKTLIILGVFALISCTKSEIDSTNTSTEDLVLVKIDSQYEEHKPYGYDELSNDDSLDRFTISDYNTDIDDIKNIERPTESKIENYKFDKNNLFGIWVQDPGPETPHATFQLTEKSFFVVDYDGDGDMPYLIKDDSITVFYNDFITRGKIIESKNREELIIHWNNSKRPTVYYAWKN